MSGSFNGSEQQDNKVVAFKEACNQYIKKLHRTDPFFEYKTFVIVYAVKLSNFIHDPLAGPTQEKFLKHIQPLLTSIERLSENNIQIPLDDIVSKINNLERINLPALIADAYGSYYNHMFPGREIPNQINADKDSMSTLLNRLHPESHKLAIKGMKQQLAAVKKSISQREASDVEQGPQESSELLDLQLKEASQILDDANSTIAESSGVSITPAGTSVASTEASVAPTDRIPDLEEKLSQQAGQIYELHEKLNLVRKTNADLVTQVEALTKDNAALKTKEKSLTEELNAAHAITESITRVLTSTTKEVDTLTATIKEDKATYDAAINALQLEMKKQKDGYEEKTKLLQKQLDTAKSVNNGLQNQLISLQAEVNTLKREHTKEIDGRLEQQIQSLQDKHKLAIQELEKKIAEITSEHNRKIHEQDLEIKALKAKLTETPSPAEDNKEDKNKAPDSLAEPAPMEEPVPILEPIGSISVDLEALVPAIVPASDESKDDEPKNDGLLDGLYTSSPDFTIVNFRKDEEQPIGQLAFFNPKGVKMFLTDAGNSLDDELIPTYDNEKIYRLMKNIKVDPPDEKYPTKVEAYSRDDETLQHIAGIIRKSSESNEKNNITIAINFDREDFLKILSKFHEDLQQEINKQPDDMKTSKMYSIKIEYTGKDKADPDLQELVKKHNDFTDKLLTGDDITQHLKTDRESQNTLISEIKELQKGPKVDDANPAASKKEVLPPAKL